MEYRMYYQCNILSCCCVLVFSQALIVSRALEFNSFKSTLNMKSLNIPKRAEHDFRNTISFYKINPLIRYFFISLSLSRQYILRNSIKSLATQYQNYYL